MEARLRVGLKCARLDESCDIVSDRQQLLPDRYSVHGQWEKVEGGKMQVARNVQAARDH